MNQKVFRVIDRVDFVPSSYILVFQDSDRFFEPRFLALSLYVELRDLL